MGAVPRWLSAVRCGCAWAVASLLWTSLSWAHPAGFTSVNRYVGVQCLQHREIDIAYLIDFAEMPTLAELDSLDADHDGTLTPPEQKAYLAKRLPPLIAAWTVTVDGRPATPRVTGSSLEVLTGERGMQTLRIAADVAVDVSPDTRGDSEPVLVQVRDPNFADRSGWREIAGEDSAFARLVSGPRESGSGALAYGNGAPAPPRLDQATLVFALSPGPQAPRTLHVAWPSAKVDARLTELSLALRQKAATLPLSLAALGLAALLGAIHALSPGHGKALAAASLAGSRGHPSRALAFGATVAVAHSAVVFTGGLLALAIERSLGSDRLMRHLELVSAIGIVLLGGVQLSRRWRELADPEAAHDHAFPSAGGASSLLALGLSAGIVPCPSALALLLAAVAMHRTVFGLVLVGAFSVGVALTLSAVGLVVVLARDALQRVPAASFALRLLPVASSACILVVGVLLCASALPSGLRP